MVVRTTLSDRARKLALQPTQLGIIEFAESKQGLGITLFPAQKFLLKVFEKEPLDDTERYIPISDKFNERVIKYVTEYEFYDMLLIEGRFSLDYETYCANPTIQIQLCMGRRASKSTMVGVWLAYQLYKILNIYHPQDYFKILPKDSMNITMTALGQDNANRLFSKFVSIISLSPFFKPYMRETPTGSHLRLWTQYDLDNLDPEARASAHSNSINVFAEANTPGVRGENNMFVVGDEFAHFNKSSKSTRDKPLDEAIYEALVPSVSGFKTPEGDPFGKALFLSSPNGKTGKFWQDCDDALRLGKDSYTLYVQCSSWEVNRTIQTAFLKKEYNKNPASYDQEYGGKFLNGGVNWLQDMRLFYAMFDKTLNPLQPVGRRDREYFLGVDFALSNDGTACSIAHWEPEYIEIPESFMDEAFSYYPDILTTPRPKGKYIIDYTEVRYAGKPPYENRKVLLIEEILDWVEDLYFKWPIRYGCFDQWSGEIIKQMVEARGIKRFEMIKFSQYSNDSMYKLFSTLLHQDEIKMPADPTLIRELLALKVENKEHGIIKVEVPASVGHDDRFDAIIRALYLAYSHRNKNLSLAGESLQNLFNRSSIVKSSGDLAGITNEAVFKRLQSQYHGTENSIRNPNHQANNARLMAKAMPRNRRR